MTSLEKGITDPKILNKRIRRMALKVIAPAALILLAVAIIDYLELVKANNEFSAFHTVLIIIVIQLVYFEFSLKRVYRFRLGEKDLELYCVSLFGRKRQKNIPLDTIKSVKFRQNNPDLNNGRLWLHFDKHVEEYIFFPNELGQSLTNHLNVQKL